MSITAMSHGPVMLDLLGLEVTSEEREILKHPATGGVILFSRNFESPEQVENLINQIKSVRSPKLLIAVDQEGGRVQRFKKGFSRLPAAARFGQYYDHDHKKALHITQEIAWLMATELRSVGVDFSFAPVLDLGIGISDVIGDRAFHKDPMIISQLSHAWMKGSHEAGMPSVGKHFPGHGCIKADSHLALPIDSRSFTDIQKADMIPFKNMIEYGLDAIMPAHVIYDKVAPELAGFSHFWLKDVLRKQLFFHGVIFSDDLTMAAAENAGSYSERARLSLEAGCDMVLVCNNSSAAVEVLESLVNYSDPVSHSRMARMHGHKNVDRKKLHMNVRWHNAIRLLDLLHEEESLDLDFNDPTTPV